MNTSKAALWSLALITASGSSLAAVEWQAEVLLGRAKQYATSRQLLTTPHGQDVSYGLRLGGYFFRHLGVDVTYFGYGAIDNSTLNSYYYEQNTKVQSTAVQIGIVGELPIGERLLLKGRVGQSFSKSKLEFFDADKIPGQFSRTASGQDPFLSIGTALKVQDNMWISLEYNYSELKHSVMGMDYENAVENLSLGWIWRFK